MLVFGRLGHFPSLGFFENFLLQRILFAAESGKHSVGGASAALLHALQIQLCDVLMSVRTSVAAIALTLHKKGADFGLVASCLDRLFFVLLYLFQFLDNFRLAIG